VRDDDRLPENLASTLRELVVDPARLIDMGRRARQAGHDDAAARIARVCFEVAGVERKAA
jgi:UDP-N-acetylglucosamine--N-acetylmuramyl-(pentapeptide) pyrophosphoryl-undecaprenol N-acetylglucosamine transferase